MQVKIKKLHPKAVIPSYTTAGAACFDLTAVGADEWNDTDQYVQYRTGLAFEIPQGHVGLIFPRSSISNTHQTLANCVGVIDSDYRGEVTVRMRNSSAVNAFLLRRMAYETYELPEKKIYKIGERVAQMMIVPVQQVVFAVTEELSDTERGSGGYGSTGTIAVIDDPIIEG